MQAINYQRKCHISSYAAADCHALYSPTYNADVPAVYITYSLSKKAFPLYESALTEWVVF